MTDASQSLPEPAAPVGALLLPGGAWIADPTAGANRLPVVKEASTEEVVCMETMPDYGFACTLGGKHDLHCATITGGRVVAAWPRIEGDQP